MSLLNFLKQNQEARKIFGKRELKIIEKQLWGMSLSQSEKNRLSRDIRKKLEFIKKISEYIGEFPLKQGTEIKRLIEKAKKLILEHRLSKRIKEIAVFGSVISKEHNLDSDIDISVFFDKINKKEAFIFRKETMGNMSNKIDVQVYNILPKNLKRSINGRKRVIYKR